MLQQPTVEAKLPKRVVIAEDCFNLLNASQNRDLWITLSATEKAFGSEFHNVREHSFFFFFSEERREERRKYTSRAALRRVKSLFESSQSIVPRRVIVTYLSKLSKDLALA